MDILDKLPEHHRNFLEHAVPKLRHDARILGVAVGGSILLGTADEFSDIDLVVVVDPAHYDSVLNERKVIVGAIGPLIEQGC